MALNVCSDFSSINKFIKIADAALTSENSPYTNYKLNDFFLKVLSHASELEDRLPITLVGANGDDIVILYGSGSSTTPSNTIEINHSFLETLINAENGPVIFPDIEDIDISQSSISSAEDYYDAASDVNAFILAAYVVKAAKGLKYTSAKEIPNIYQVILQFAKYLVLQGLSIPFDDAELYAYSVYKNLNYLKFPSTLNLNACDLLLNLRSDLILVKDAVVNLCVETACWSDTIRMRRYIADEKCIVHLPPGPYRAYKSCPLFLAIEGVDRAALLTLAGYHINLDKCIKDCNKKCCD